MTVKSRTAAKIAAGLLGAVVLVLALVLAGHQLGQLLASPVVLPAPAVTVTAERPGPTAKPIDRGETDDFGALLPSTNLNYVLTGFKMLTPDDVAQIIGLKDQKVITAALASYAKGPQNTNPLFQVVAVQFATTDQAAVSLQTSPVPHAELVSEDPVLANGQEVGQAKTYKVGVMEPGDTLDPNQTGTVVWSNGTTVVWVTGPIEKVTDFYLAFPL